MSCVVPFPSCYCRDSLLPGKGLPLGGDWQGKMQNAAQWRQCRARSRVSRTPPLIIKAHMVTPSTFSSRISTDIPFYEAPEASFAQYLEDKPRVFRAIFPEKQASQQLNEEEWRIHMLPVKSPFLTVWPVVDMRLRCNSNVLEYPSGVPHHISKVLELEMIRSELQGLDNVLKQAQFSLGVKGAMYSDRRGAQSRLKGQTLLSMSVSLPPMLALLPEHVCRDAAELVLKRLAENMKHTVNASLLADYSEFKRERLKDLA